MSFDRIRQVADAVLLEGYVLYPYRASSTKNRYRWTFGVIAPQAWSEGVAGCEAWWVQSEQVIDGPAGARVEGVLRFMQMQRRTVEERDGSGYREVDAIERDGETVIPWEEGIVREVPIGPVDLAGSGGGPVEVPFSIPASVEDEPVRGRMRILRRRWALHGRVLVWIEREGELARLRVRVENLTEVDDAEAPREAALRRAFLSAHVMLRADGGAFVSLLDPPPGAREAVDRCRNVRVFPVLAGSPEQRDLVLVSPIILYDHPQIAPESPGDFFDATEIDELLTLRTQTLTDAEKREVRATDPRAAALLDRVERIPPEMMERLHGALRDLAPIAVSASYQPGRQVRLRPGARRTDAQDILFAGRTATIRKVLEDVEGKTWLAVTIDDDPAAEMHEWYGRFHYYYTDEVELLGEKIS